MKGFVHARLLNTIARIERERDWASLPLLLGEMRKEGYILSIVSFSPDNVEAAFTPIGSASYTALDTDMLFAVCHAAQLALRVENVVMTT